MKYTRLILSLFFFSLSIGAKECPTSPIESPYVSSGKFTVHDTSFVNKKLTDKKIHIFLPQGKETPAPLLFLFPRSSSNGPEEYKELIKFITSQGVAVVFPPSYRSLDLKKSDIDEYNDLSSLLPPLIGPYRNKIDTSRIGFVGHGFGAGIIPALVHDMHRNLKWGKNGILMDLLSPGYFSSIGTRELQNYPSQVHLLITSFEEDNINDPVIGKELFERISLPLAQKEWYYIPDARNDDCKMIANFTLPLGAEGVGGEMNSLDYYGIQAPLGAAILGVFEKDSSAYTFAFGNGNQRPLSMGTWKDGTPLPFMIGTDYPEPYINRRHAVNMWISGRNRFAAVTEFRRRRKHVSRSLGNKVKRAGQLVGDILTKDKDEDSLSANFANPIFKGYGAPGKYSMQIDSVNNPATEHKVRLFTPKGVKGKLPVIVLLHGYSGPEYEFFEPLITHLVSHGYAIIYPPYPGMPGPTREEHILSKFTIVRKGLNIAFDTWKDKLDTTRVLVAGQSFGGGMVPAIGHDLLVKRKFGTKGAALFAMAPWYTYEITDSMYQEFPKHTQMLVQVYDEDVTNDHQMAVELYNSLPVPKDQKDYMILYGDQFEEQQMIANHFVPYGRENMYGDENLLDYYGVFRPFQALADYALKNDTLAYTYALGGGTEEQTFMGYWTPQRLYTPSRVTDAPYVTHPQLQYLFSWEANLNPRFKKQ